MTTALFAAAVSKQNILYLALAGDVLMAAAVVATAASDSTSVVWPVAMLVIALAAALRIEWRFLLAAVPVTWLLLGFSRSLVESTSLISLASAIELAGLCGFAYFAFLVRRYLDMLAQDSESISAVPESGIFPNKQLAPFIEAEIARSRRFSRTFALLLVGIDERRQRYDFRDTAAWQASLTATERLLRQTRQNVDRVFHYGHGGFAIILPESTEQDIPGLVRRLRRLARTTTPREGDPGGPLPIHFGATFFPESATGVTDLLRRAEVALRIAATSTTRYQLDGAEAPELPPAETFRREAGELYEPAQVPLVDEDNDGEEESLPTADVVTLIPTDSEPIPPRQEVAPLDHTANIEPVVATETPEDTGSEDLELLLGQMNETLAMIRAARDKVA